MKDCLLYTSNKCGRGHARTIPSVLHVAFDVMGLDAAVMMLECL